jgi:hypothetical protein
MNGGVHKGSRARVKRVNISNNSSRCLINEHLRSIYRRLMTSITMFIMPLSNHYITTQHSHRVNMDF